MPVVLNWEAFKSSLVNMSFARCVVMGPITHRVCRGDPVHEPTQLTIGVRPQYKMPMIGHQLEAKEPDIVRNQPLPKNSLKCGIVLGLVENLLASVTPIQGMV